MVRIGTIARTLHLSVKRVRGMINEGIIPDAPVRGPGDQRLWPAEAVTQMQVIAREEGQPSKPQRHLSRTNFSVRMHQVAESWGRPGDQA